MPRLEPVSGEAEPIGGQHGIDRMCLEWGNMWTMEEMIEMEHQETPNDRKGKEEGQEDGETFTHDNPTKPLVLLSHPL